MTLAPHLLRVSSALTTYSDQLAWGSSRSRVTQQVRDGTFVTLGRSGLVPSAEWDSWHPGDRHLAAVLAAAREARTTPVFSHYSAAVLLGLPLWAMPQTPVHVISTTSRARSSTVVRHLLEVDDADIVEIAGFSCTSPNRTLADLAAVCSDELLIGCADAVIRGVAGNKHRVDEGAWTDWRQQMLDQASAQSGGRGVRRLRRVVQLADPRSDSPLESVSRLHFARLDVTVEPQFAIPSPDGGFYFADFLIVGQGILGECDGAQKYLDPTMLGGRTAGATVVREKRRDDWMAGRSRSRMIHWGAREARTTASFAHMLHAFGVQIPLRRRRW